MGAEYFEHILIDYEPTANWGNWAYRIATTAALGGKGAVGASRESEVQTPEMLLWARQHDPAARHIKLWLPELAALPAEVALEPWRLLIPELCPPSLTPADQQPWDCSQCTFRNRGKDRQCEVRL